MEVRSLIKRAIPKPLHPLARTVWWWMRERPEEWLRLRDPMTPPKRLHFVGAGDFAEVGEHLVSLLRKHTGLLPSERVLDVGSGNGRVAVRLTRYLNELGSYEGL